MSGARPVEVIGGGLAGAEAAWQIARRKVPVRIWEMRPEKGTPAHRTGDLAELVCSNSLKTTHPAKPHGLLKEEMSLLGSLILECAQRTRVPAGTALAVDRNLFARAVTDALEADPHVTVVRREVEEIPAEGPVIVAAGPLVSESLAAALALFTGRDNLYFYDAIAPVIETESIDRAVVYAASRYDGEAEGDYLNCPLSAEEYERFVDALLQGGKVPFQGADSSLFFEGCLPVEELARRGRETLRFGPMKPVGLRDPRSGERSYAVIQLRQDNLAAEHYSMVGFQTRLLWPEQKRIFRMLPGLGGAEFARFGQMHRNSYINAPALLEPTLACTKRRELFFAGQISGVEGYTESAATGLLAGINAARLFCGEEPVVPPPETMLGSMCRYLATSDPDAYQPRNATFGLLPPPLGRVGGRKARRQARSDRALAAMREWVVSLQLPS